MPREPYLEKIENTLGRYAIQIEPPKPPVNSVVVNILTEDGNIVADGAGMFCDLVALWRKNITFSASGVSIAPNGNDSGTYTVRASIRAADGFASLEGTISKGLLDAWITKPNFDGRDWRQCGL